MYVYICLLSINFYMFNLERNRKRLACRISQDPFFASGDVLGCDFSDQGDFGSCNERGNAAEASFGRLVVTLCVRVRMVMVMDGMFRYG